MAKHTTAFIWRQSIYENDFKCKCGYKLFDTSKNEPARDVLIDQIDNYMYCPKCGLAVGKIVDMGETDMKSGLYGYWPEFEKRKAN